jgi:hypothetical protein
LGGLIPSFLKRLIPSLKRRVREDKALFVLIPILYEDTPNYMRNEPQRRGSAVFSHWEKGVSSMSDCRRKGHKEERKFGVVSQRNGIRQLVWILHSFRGLLWERAKIFIK